MTYCKGLAGWRSDASCLQVIDRTIGPSASCGFQSTSYIVDLGSFTELVQLASAPVENEQHVCVAAIFTTTAPSSGVRLRFRGGAIRRGAKKEYSGRDIQVEFENRLPQAIHLVSVNVGGSQKHIVIVLDQHGMQRMMSSAQANNTTLTVSTS